MIPYNQYKIVKYSYKGAVMKKDFKIININGTWILFCIFSVLVTVIPFGMTLLIEIFSRIAFNKNPSMLRPGIIYFILWALSSLLVRFGYTKLKSLVSYNWNKRMKYTLMDRLLNRRVSHFIEKDRAEYISIFNNDISFMQDKYLFSINNIFGSIFLFLFSVIYSFTINTFITIIILFSGLIIMFITNIVSKKAANANDLHLMSLKNYNETLNDGLYGYGTLYQSNKSSGFMKLFLSKTESLEKEHSKAVFTSGLLVSFINYLSGTIQVSIFLILALFVYLGHMDVVYYPVMMSLMNLLIYPMQTIAENYGNIKSSKTVRMRFIEEMKPSKNEDHSVRHSIQPNIMPPRTSGHIDFLNIDFSYGDKIIFKDSSFIVNKNEHLMISGGSGSGKSTILKLLTDECEYKQGEIFIDGINLRDLDRSELFEMISVIPQHPMIFRMSILQNIVLFEDEDTIDFEKLERVISEAGLNSYIDSLSEGVSTILKDAGSNLSGGEKQRIEIARALYRDTPIILIDEATSGLDLERAKSLEEIFRSLNKTIISISHRRDLDMSKYYDRILKIKDKKIISESI